MVSPGEGRSQRAHRQVQKGLNSCSREPKEFLKALTARERVRWGP